MKKNYFLILLFGIFLFISITVYSSNQSTATTKQTKAVGLITISQTKTKKLIKGKKVAIYVGRDTCPDCQKIMPELKKQLKNNKKVLYYFDTTAKGEKLLKYRKFYNSLGVQAVPSILIAKNGKVEKIFNLEKDQTDLPKIIKEEI
ncbi:MAG: thioredoxin fold domain-containing protein [Streptococcaceae bacterium]|nr:thioredoxin fold domain-containing protein [Streptococcaceae bacterium]